MANMPVRGLTDYDYAVIAERLKVEPEALQAVGHVESRDTAFYDDGFPVILFERHKFYKHARRDKRAEWSRLYPTICNGSPTPRGGYGSKSAQRVKFSQAFALDPDAAMMACSWGAFQELGENYDDYGFESVGEFVDMMKSGIAGHLEIFVRSIKKRGLVDELQRKDWAGFARNYNGAGYRRFEYDTQMANAYRIFKNKRVNWKHVLQTGDRLLQDDEINDLTDHLGSTVIDPAGSPSTSPNEPAVSPVESPEPGAEGSPAASGDGENVEISQTVGETVETESGSKTVESTVTTAAGDAPNVEPSHFFSIEDWKPWAKRWASRIWGGVTTLSVPSLGGFSFAALQGGPNWYIYAIAGAVVIALIIGIGIFATLVIAGIWLWQNRGIPAIKQEQLRILADPNMKNVGLSFVNK